MSGSRQRSTQAANNKVGQHGGSKRVTLAAFAAGQTLDAEVADVVQQGTQRKLVAPGHLAAPGVRQAQLQRINEGVGQRVKVVA